MNISGPSTVSGSTSPKNSGIKQPLVPAGRFLPFILVTALFFLWGIPNNLNDILIPQFMKSFEINRFEASLVQFAFYMGYFLLALPAGLLMRRVGYKAGILTGLILYGIGCCLFWPAAMVGQYWFFLTALFVIASGLAFLETAASPFIVQLGDPESSEGRLNFSQAFNPLGSITAVLIGRQFIFSGIELKPDQIAAMQAAHTYQDYLRSETLRVVVPYIVIGAVVFIWALLIARTPFPHGGLDYSRATLQRDHSRPVWKRRHFVSSVVAQFLYVGAQVGVWSYLISYVHHYTGTAERSASLWLTGCLAAVAAGRFASSALLRVISGHTLLGIFAVINTALVAVVALHPGWLGVWCLLLMSFFMSMMFPTIFALGIKGLGTRTKTAGSILVMSIIGGAAIPPIMGKLPDIAVSYFVPGVCFALVAIYAFLFSQPKPIDIDA